MFAKICARHAHQRRLGLLEDRGRPRHHDQPFSVTAHLGRHEHRRVQEADAGPRPRGQRVGRTKNDVGPARHELRLALRGVEHRLEGDLAEGRLRGVKN